MQEVRLHEKELTKSSQSVLYDDEDNVLGEEGQGGVLGSSPK